MRPNHFNVVMAIAMLFLELHMVYRPVVAPLLLIVLLFTRRFQPFPRSEHG